MFLVDHVFSPMNTCVQILFNATYTGSAIKLCKESNEKYRLFKGFTRLFDFLLFCVVVVSASYIFGSVHWIVCSRFTNETQWVSIRDIYEFLPKDHRQPARNKSFAHRSHIHPMSERSREGERWKWRDRNTWSNLTDKLALNEQWLRRTKQTDWIGYIYFAIGQSIFTWTLDE